MAMNKSYEMGPWLIKEEKEDFESDEWDGETKRQM